MLKTIRLNVLPALSTNCVSWSKDGCISIVAYSEIIILVPKHRVPSHHPVSSKQQRQQFYHTKASLRKWIEDNYPIPQPADIEIWSAAEEMSPGHTRAVTWSPMGTSKFRRCMCAVLTSNLVVCVFEPIGQPGLDWTMKHDLRLLMKDPTGDEMAQRMKARVRAMDWSSACGSSWGESLLALANDYMEIVLMKVNHEKAERIHTIRPFTEQYVRKRIGRERTYLAHLTWSPWREGGKEGEYCSMIAFAYAGQVYVQDITMEIGLDGGLKVFTNSKKRSVGMAASRINLIHAIAWAPEPFDGKALLSYAVSRRTTIIAFDATGMVVDVADYRNDFIAPTAGLNFSPSPIHKTVAVHQATINGNYLSILYPPTEEAVPINEETHWTYLLPEMEGDYMADQDIQTARTRIFGTAISPLGNITLTLASFHPDDQVEYITAAAEKTHVVFGTHSNIPVSWNSTSIDAETPVPTPYDMAPETLIVEALALGDDYTSQLKETLSNHIHEPSSLTAPHSIPSLNHTVFGSSPLNAARYHYALELLDAPLKPPNEDPEILYHSIIAVLTSPFTSDKQSMRLIYSLATVGILAFPGRKELLSLAGDAFKWLDTHTPASTRFDRELSVVSWRLGEGPAVNIDNGIVSSLESCVLCGEGVVWKDARVVECTEGHRFTRCAVTFLPVTEKRGVAECGICGKGSLVLRDEEGLAGTVGRCWDVCVGCGGRLWCGDEEGEGEKVEVGRWGSRVWRRGIDGVHGEQDDLVEDIFDSDDDYYG